MIIIKETNGIAESEYGGGLHRMTHILHLVGSNADHCFCYHCRDHMVEILMQRGYKPVIDGKQIQVTQPDGTVSIFSLAERVQK